MQHKPVMRLLYHAKLRKFRVSKKMRKKTYYIIIMLLIAWVNQGVLLSEREFRDHR